MLRKPAREIENELDARLTPCVIDRLRLRAVHACKIRCTNKESLSQAPTTERLQKTLHLQGFCSTATGIRTPVSAVRGRRPGPLDDSGRELRRISVATRFGSAAER